MMLILARMMAAAPLFVLIFIGYGLGRWGGWTSAVADALNRFVFALALPAMLFSTLSDFSRLPPVDVRLLLAFFGGALIVFGFGRVLASKVFRLDGVSGSVFALGGIFSNNAMLGLPLARATLGEQAVPCVALVLVFNSLILWTLVTVSVEWARNGSLSVRGFARTARSVLANPLVVGIMSGTAWGLTGWPLPALIGEPVGMLGAAAVPLALVVLGMGLAAYPVREGLGVSAAVCTLKLIVSPLVVAALAWALGLPRLETQVVILLSSMALGVNVYLMARQFKALEGPIASAMVLSTGLAALTTPIVLELVRN